MVPLPPHTQPWDNKDLCLRHRRVRDSTFFSFSLSRLIAYFYSLYHFKDCCMFNLHVFLYGPIFRIIILLCVVVRYDLFLNSKYADPGIFGSFLLSNAFFLQLIVRSTGKIFTTPCLILSSNEEMGRYSAMHACKYRASPTAIVNKTGRQTHTLSLFLFLSLALTNALM